MSYSSSRLISWRVEGGGWRVEGGGWRVEGGEMEKEYGWKPRHDAGPYDEENAKDK
jgi:hypothetical protein